MIPPRKGRRHALRVIRDLVAFQPVGRRTNLAASLSYASRLLRHRSIVVVLSDFIAEGWERPLRRLASRHEVVAVTVIAAEAWWADAFFHGTGHGVGLDIHERPPVGGASTATLAAGHVITVEPGVYLPRHGGVRIEDTVVVTPDGRRPLTKATKATAP